MTEKRWALISKEFDPSAHPAVVGYLRDDFEQVETISENEVAVPIDDLRRIVGTATLTFDRLCALLPAGDPEPLPCPADDGVLVHVIGSGWKDVSSVKYSVQCSCGVCGPLGKDKLDAIARWNAVPRVKPDPSVAARRVREGR